MIIIYYASLFYLAILFIVILFDMRADKNTRKCIKEIAKKNNLPYHVVQNEILRDFCNKYDKEIIIKFNSNPKELTYEEWRAARETERQSDTESSQ